VKIWLRLIAIFSLIGGSAIAQPAAFKDPLLDCLIGHWVLKGTIGGKETTHDIAAEWVLGHQYVRIHELSREKGANEQAAYEAIVFIGWDQPSSEYACLWLDSTGGGGISAPAIGHGKRGGDEIPFIFRESDGSISFKNTFSFDRSANSWVWLMDNVQNGKSVPFARLKLTRQ
jgi:hypothetical protein